MKTGTKVLVGVGIGALAIVVLSRGKTKIQVEKKESLLPEEYAIPAPSPRFATAMTSTSRSARALRDLARGDRSALEFVSASSRRQDAHIGEIESAIKSMVADKAGYKIIPGNWTHGGCCILAYALQRLFGGRIWTISSPRYPIEHFVLELDGVFLDGDGAFTQEELLAKMDNEPGIDSPRLKIWGLSRRALSTIFCSDKQILATVKLLKAHMRLRQPPLRGASFFE